MAKKSFVILTSAVGIAAVATGMYAARKRRFGTPAVNVLTESKPFAAAGESARRFGTDWRSTDDQLTEELANVIDEKTAAAR